VLRARGADVVPFLQGQLSCDVSRLTAEQTLLAGYHNPQGRVIALMRLFKLADDDVALVLPRELAATVAQRLAKFVLRAKVKIADDSAAWQVYGLVGSPATAAADGAFAALPAAANASARLEDGWVVRVADSPARYLWLAGAGPLPASLATLPTLPSAHWQRLMIAAGEPQVYAATSEEFVAQMLNLDVLGALAFDKGCFTGQEVIARAHYRGRVKRRLQRFSVPAAAPPAPGSTIALADGRTARVVTSVALGADASELLAVTTLAGEADAGAPDPAPLAAQQLPLPYALPD
jgi:folate-binding protein YgfZ